LNLLGLSVRDMPDANVLCQLTPWSSIFDRIRADLDHPCGLKRNSQSFREPPCIEPASRCSTGSGIVFAAASTKHSRKRSE